MKKQFFGQLLAPVCMLAGLFMTACRTDARSDKTAGTEPQPKIVIYQVFTRLFGNTNTTNKPWGTIADNGVGKMADFTETALDSIKALGVTHIWYTGIPHHALIGDYTAYGISNDDPDVVKGRAGSPYAVKDYYSVNPDLATDPARRLEEFRALVQRTHDADMRVIIDIVPNHVARHYVSLSRPDSVEDFGARDDTSVAYARNNNFYYLPGEAFRTPAPEGGYQPLGGEPHPLSDGKFDERPAKWTGNGSRLAQPRFDDWYETVKINYGVRPDGTKDFDTLPGDYARRPTADHYRFWQGRNVPDSWKKFRDIALFWLDIGVDGFRFDMAEMVPVEFWSYMNSAIKHRQPDALLLAEVYNPAEYRNYIRLGRMDYLYDKVELYDTLRHIIQGHGSTDNLPAIFEGLADIEPHMLHFLENHDEQRIASPAFAGNPFKALPAMVVSAMVGTSPTLIYFGQEVGEPGAERGGFGQPTRTSIFDYVGVPHHQRWMNGGRFDGGQLKPDEKELRAYYRRLLNLTLQNHALTGHMADLHRWNRSNSDGYGTKQFAFARWTGRQRLLVFVNFDADNAYNGGWQIPPELIKTWNMKDGAYRLTELLNGKGEKVDLEVREGIGYIKGLLPPLASWVLEMW